MEALRHGIVNGLAAFYDQALEWLAAHAGTIVRTQCARRDVKGLAQARNARPAWADPAARSES
jgi:hypothetical protein